MLYQREPIIRHTEVIVLQQHLLVQHRQDLKDIGALGLVAVAPLNLGPLEIDAVVGLVGAARLQAGKGLAVLVEQQEGVRQHHVAQAPVLPVFFAALLQLGLEERALLHHHNAHVTDGEIQTGRGYGGQGGSVEFLSQALCFGVDCRVDRGQRVLLGGCGGGGGVSIYGELSCSAAH